MHLPIQYKPDTSKTTPEKYIYTVENFIPVVTCQELKTYIDQNPSTHRRGSKTSNVIASFSTCLMPEPNKVIYSLINDLINDYNSRHRFNIIYMEPLELKRYDIGDKFGMHIDNYFGTNYGLDRKLNIIVQLSDITEYEGGDLLIGSKPGVSISKCVGTTTIFPAHYLHEVLEITRGNRYSLIGHVWGPEFK